MEARGDADTIEQCGLRGGHPHLAASFEASEQGGAALRIEMGGDFVEEQDGRRGAPFRDEIGVGKDEPQQ